MKQLESLLFKADQGTLGEDEERQLSETLQSDDAVRFAATYHQLRRGMQTKSHAVGSHEVRRVSAEINARLTRARRRKRLAQGGQLSLGIAALVLITWAVLWRALPQTVVEVAQPQAPLPNYRLVTLADTEPTDRLAAYNLTIQEAHALADYPIWVPTQLRDTFTYQGARFDRLEQTVELAFIQTAGPLPHEIIWVFTQRPAPSWSKNKLLRNQYSAENFSEKRLIDIRNAEFGPQPATFHQYQQGTGRNSSQFENRLAWQTDGQQFTIAAMADIRIDETIVGAYGEKWWLTKLQR